MSRQTGRQKKRVQGFTLIELIAVLVILGILAVVAVPQYQGMQVQATQGAMQGIAAAALSQLSISYGQLSIDGTTPDAAELAGAVAGVVQISGGNYTINYTPAAGPPETVTVDVVNNDDTTITIPAIVFTLP